MAARNPAIAQTVKGCEVCGARLQLRTTRDIERKRFCSHACRGKVTGGMPTNKPRRAVTCTGCGKAFQVSPKAANAKYCSAKCLKAMCGSTEQQYARMNAGDSPLRYFKALLGANKRRGLSPDDLMALWVSQAGRCALSGVPMTFRRTLGTRSRTNASIDRISAGGAYIRSNVRLVCAIVNKMRLDMSDVELREWCKHILGD
jgi:hypothetical protein